MFRIRLALGLLFLVIASLGAPSLAAPVDQSVWAGLKKEVRLANGIKLAYVELGDPKGEPLLLLHGYTDTSRSWSVMVPHLSGYRVLMPDQRGHGASDAPECCYGPAQFAFDAKLFLDALGVKRSAVAGHSLGSMVAMAMAAEYPERVSAIVLIGSTALAPVKPGAWLYDQVAALSFPLDRSSAFMREWHPSNQPTAIDPVFAEAVMEDILLIQPHVWRGVMRELTQLPVARHASGVKARVLILSGGKDPLFPPEHHAALLKAFPKAEAHVFPELGHSPNWEQPDDVAARIDAFLKSSTKGLSK
jgi:pimeloyl-ACP methyl ester carboxylesterase